MLNAKRSALFRYSLAVAAAAIAVSVRLALDPWLANLVPFITLFMAILVVAAYAGRGPALLTTSLGGVAAIYLILQPRLSLSVDNGGQAIGVALFFIVGVGISLLGGTLRAAIERAERSLGEAIRQREELRTTLASIADAVIVADPGGSVASMNPSAERWTGWTSAEAAGKPLGDVVRVDLRGSLASRGGETRLVDRTTSTIGLADGASGGSVVVLRDVTGKHEQGQALVRNEGRLRMALDAARMVAWEWDPVDGSLHVSENAAEVFGLVEGDAITHIDQGLTLVHPDDVAAYREAYLGAIERHGSYLICYRLIRPIDGSTRWMEERGHAIVSPMGEGEGIRLTGVVMDVTDRKLAESEAVEARSRLASTLAAGEVGTWEFDIVADKVWADENLARMFGVTAEEAAGGALGSYTRAIHPEDRERVGEEIGRAIRSGDGYEASYRIVAGDGIGRWVQARGRVVRDEGGRAARLPGVVIDITAQRIAETRLRESEIRFRALFDAMDEGFCIIEIIEDAGGVAVDYRFVEMNPAFERHTGLKNATGLTIRGIVPDLEPFWFETYGRVARTGEPTRFVNEAKGLGGRWFDVYAFRLGGDGSLKVAVLFNDITDRLRAEQRLKESEERLRFALRAGRMGTWELDLASRRLTCSDTCKANYGRGPAEPFGHDELAESVLEGDRDRWRRAVDRAIRDAAGLDVEYRTRWPDGSTHWVCVRASCVVDAEGRAVAMSGVSFNIDERKRAEEGLIDADRRKDEFLATLAHELRNPLAPIRNSLQVMRMAGDDRASIEEARSLMARQVSHMVRLIDDLLDVSRITQGKLELRRVRADLATIVEAALETSRPLIESAGHSLVVKVPEARVEVDADPTRLSQVFSNLLNNAAKYTERGGHLSIEVDRRGAEVRATVRDDGVGIPPEMLPEVFGLFTQVDRSLERSQGGLGIGLTLVRRLVEMHGGTVEARSEGPGRGSEFVVRLPIVVEAEPPRPAEPPIGPAEPFPASGRHILVVDDNRDSARTLARLLKLMGNQTSTAFDGGEAVEVAERVRPEVMLLDIGMPVMSGYDVARAIRARPWGRSVTLVALTGWGQEGDRLRSTEAGFDRHLVKPVDPDELERVLAEIRPAGPEPARIEG